MKINFLLPYIDLAGGVKSTFEVAKRLQHRGHDVRIYYSKYKNVFRRRCNLKVNLINIIKPFVKREQIFDYGTNVKIEQVPFFHDRYIDNADVVIGTWWEDIFPMMALSKEKGRKYHFIRHYEIWGGSKSKVDRAYSCHTKKIVISSWLQDLVRENFKQEPELCPNGLDPSKFYYKAPSQESSGKITIGLMYRPSWAWKGMDDALAVLNEIWVRYHKSIQIILFGDRLSLPVVFPFENVISPFGEKIRKIYNDLDIFFFTSHSEGFGNPPLEAMACRTAVVSTKVGGVTDYSSHGKDIIQVEPKDRDDMVEQLSMLITNHNYRKVLSLAAEQSAKLKNWENTTDTLESILQA